MERGQYPKSRKNILRTFAHGKQRGGLGRNIEFGDAGANRIALLNFERVCNPARGREGGDPAGPHSGLALRPSDPSDMSADGADS